MLKKFKLDDLKRLGRYLHKSYAKYPDLIMEIVGGEILVEDDIDAQEECVNIVKGYITNRMPDDVDFISLIFGDGGDIYDYVRELGRSS